MSFHSDDLLHGSLVRGVHEALSQELVELLLTWCKHVHDDLCPDLGRLICNFLNHRRESLVDDVEPRPDRLDVPAIEWPYHPFSLLASVRSKKAIVNMICPATISNPRIFNPMYICM